MNDGSIPFLKALGIFTCCVFASVVCSAWISPLPVPVSENLYLLKFWFNWFLLCDTLLSWVRINYTSHLFLWWLLLGYPLFNLINITLWTAYMAGTVSCCAYIRECDPVATWEVHHLIERNICKNTDKIQSCKCYNQGENKML